MNEISHERGPVIVSAVRLFKKAVTRGRRSLEAPRAPDQGAPHPSALTMRISSIRDDVGDDCDDLGNRDADHGGGGLMDHHTVADLAITRGRVTFRQRGKREKGRAPHWGQA
jgi:hypothetical protein